MYKLFFNVILFAYIFQISEMAKGFDASAPATNGQFQKFYKDGFSFFIGKIYGNGGGGHPDINGIGNINKARETGFLDVDGYIYPCTSSEKCYDPITQINTALNVLEDEGGKVGTIWLDIENPEGWPKNITKNRQFITDLVNTTENRGYHVGIYTNKNSWTEICGNWTAYSDYPLWWPAYNNNPDLTTGFINFGGWTSAVIHQWNQKQIEYGLEYDSNVK